MITSSVIFAILTIYFSCLILLSIGFRQARRESVGKERSGSRLVATVVVAVKNEEKHIAELIESLNSQTVQTLEIVVVDNGSTDNTLSLLSAELDAGRISQLMKTQPGETGKKSALKLGIENSTSKVLLFTDADCRPGPLWAERLLQYFHDEDLPQVVVGYSPFEKVGSAVNLASRYETFITGFMTASTIGLRHPYMAVGRNLAYTKSAFETVGGFEKIMHSMSGDDDLLIQLFRREGLPVLHSFASDSFVQSEGPVTWHSWIQQKLRHASAGKYYARSTAVWLVLFHLSGLLLYLAPLAGLIGCVAFVIRLVVDWIVLKRAAVVLNENDLMIWQPVLHVTYALYNLLVAPVGLLLKRRRW